VAAAPSLPSDDEVRWQLLISWKTALQSRCSNDRESEGIPSLKNLHGHSCFVVEVQPKLEAQQEKL